MERSREGERKERGAEGGVDMLKLHTNLSGSSFHITPSHLLKYSETIAAGSGPGVRSAQGEE
ncbi:hypothetical protein NQZ68_033771 [Dissostichus eleginoides]|nr:hypothetical protein NQZ68_033771 [Dissostichus eleginoides]